MKITYERGHERRTFLFFFFLAWLGKTDECVMLKRKIKRRLCACWRIGRLRFRHDATLSFGMTRNCWRCSLPQHRQRLKTLLPHHAAAPDVALSVAQWKDVNAGRPATQTDYQTTSEQPDHKLANQPTNQSTKQINQQLSQPNQTNNPSFNQLQ